MVPCSQPTHAALWRRVMVFADETVKTAADVEALAAAGIVHGVNVKLEKAGGYDTTTGRVCQTAAFTLVCGLR